MFSPLLLLALFTTLAGQVLAQTLFNVTFGTGNLTASELLAIPASSVATACASNINNTQGLFSGCGDSNPTCLCSPDTVASFVATETCMLNFLIAQNIKSPSPLAGSNVLVGAYSSACKENGILLPATQSALVLPPGWDGPFVAVLSTGPTIVVVGIGAMLGFSALYILSNLE